jgi:hypothetical protein
MGIFSLFNRKPQKNKYELFYDSITELLKLMERKRGLVEGLKPGSSTLDFTDTHMFERLKVVELIKSGSITFLGNEFKNEILEIFENQEIKKDTIQHVCSYLINEQNKLKKLF